jgi:periplasmic divalent cation tolerance protein
MSRASETDEVVVFITAPTDEEAALIAKSVVESKLAACVNIIRSIRSIYSWQGKVEDDNEVLMIVKTRQELFESLSARVKELHSYDVPEVIALPIVKGSEDYLTWLRDSTTE